MIKELLKWMGLGFFVIACVYAGPIVYARINEAREDAYHRQPVHPGDSTITVDTERQSNRNVPMRLTNVNGQTFYVLANEGETESFINQLIERLESERRVQLERLCEDIRDDFEVAFQSRDNDVDDFADWHFSWNRKYDYLATAAGQMIGSVLSLDIEDVSEEGKQAVRKKFMLRYERTVLRPEIRDPIIQERLRRSILRAHERYVREMSYLDRQFQAYIAENTTLLDEPDVEEILQVDLDWDPEHWKSPYYSAEGAPTEAVFTAVADVAGGALSYYVLARAIEAVFLETFLPLVANVITGIGTELAAAEGGGAIGTFVEPGGGTAIGAVVGIAGAVLTETLISENSENLQRPDFIEAVNEGLDVTIDGWSGLACERSEELVNVWFDDTINVLAYEILRD